MYFAKTYTPENVRNVLFIFYTEPRKSGSRSNVQLHLLQYNACQSSLVHFVYNELEEIKLDKTTSTTSTSKMIIVCLLYSSSSDMRYCGEPEQELTTPPDTREALREALPGALGSAAMPAL